MLNKLKRRVGRSRPITKEEFWFPSTSLVALITLRFGGRGVGDRMESASGVLQVSSPKKSGSSLRMYSSLFSVLSSRENRRAGRRRWESPSSPA